MTDHENAVVVAFVAEAAVAATAGGGVAAVAV